MKKVKMIVVGIALVLCWAGLMIAADTATQTFSLSVLDICVIGVTGNPNNLVVQAPSSGGETPDSPFDDSTYALYTSIVGSGQARQITAEWGATDSAPSGTSLRLEVTEIAGVNEGSAAGEITMTDSPQPIITGIGSCATGTGIGGAKLKYTLSVDDVTQLVASSSETVTITLTLSDAS
jgi:hypothetical protein